MAKEDDVLNSGSEGAPVQGVTGSPSSPGTVKFIKVDSDGHLQVDVLSGGGGGVDPVGLKNTGGTPINPSTEDTLSTLNAKFVSGTDIGDVTINNASGASAVNIQDGGNSITIDATSLPLPTGAATAANQLPDGHNVTVDNASGASAVNIQDGGNSITVDGTVSVSSISTSITPGTGASNLGKAEDAAHSSGHVGVMALGVRNTNNATLTSATLDYSPIGVNAEGSPRIVGDRASGATDANNPVKIGGVFNTTQPTFTDGQRGNIQISNRGEVLVAPGATGFSSTVTQATHDNLNANANIQISDSDVSTSNPVPVQGRVAQGGALTGNPVPIGMRDLAGQVETWACNDLGGNISLGLCQLVDGGLGFQDFATDGSTPVVGNTAHDAVDADAGEGPVKIGVYASDYDPDTDAEQGRTEVAAADRANVAGNLRGELIEGVNARYHVWSNISTTYNNTTTTQTSDTIECWNYRQATLSFEITKTNAPTDITFEIETSMDGTNFSKNSTGPLGLIIYDDVVVGSGIKRNITFPIAANDMRVKVTATGTTASATFTVANAAIMLRN